jgi:transposase
VAAHRTGRIGQYRHDLEYAAPARFDAQKKCLEAAERTRADIAEARRLWAELQSKLDVRRLVFLDETWTKTNMIRLYGRAPRGVRVIGRVPHGRWQTTTFLAGLRHDRIVAPLLLEGAIDGPSFLAWVEQFLAPTLEPGDIVVADNLGSHKVVGVREVIRARGASILYLPSYSPDLNPIEQLFAKLKTLIRGLAPRTREALLYRPRLLRHQVEAYAARAAG